jgi:hypothetical protein
MFAVLTLMSKAMFLPIWLLWHGYGMLWWAFDDDAPAASTQETPERGSSFEVFDSRAAANRYPKPVGVLRGGFVGSLGASAIFGVAAGALEQQEVVTSPHAVMLWAWASIVTLVASIFAVRHVVRKQRAKLTVAQRVRRAASRVGEGAAAAVAAGAATRPGGLVRKACRGIGGVACTAGRAACSAGKVASRGGAAVASGAAHAWRQMRTPARQSVPRTSAA